MKVFNLIVMLFFGTIAIWFGYAYLANAENLGYPERVKTIAILSFFTSMNASIFYFNLFFKKEV